MEEDFHKGNICAIGPVAVKVAETWSYACGKISLNQKEIEIDTRALFTAALRRETDLQSYLWRTSSCFRERKRSKKSSGGSRRDRFHRFYLLSDHLRNAAEKAKADLLCTRVSVQRANTE